MWLMTPDAGFLSVVQHDRQPKHLLVRARRQSDLLGLLDFLYDERNANPAIGRNDDADYRWRLVVKRKHFKAWLASQVDAVEYPSHAKEEMAGDDTELLDAYYAVWRVLATLQPPLDRRDPHSSGRDRFASYREATWPDEPDYDGTSVAPGRIEFVNDPHAGMGWTATPCAFEWACPESSMDHFCRFGRGHPIAHRCECGAERERYA